MYSISGEERELLQGYLTRNEVEEFNTALIKIIERKCKPTELAIDLGELDLAQASRDTSITGLKLSVTPQDFGNEFLAVQGAAKAEVACNVSFKNTQGIEFEGCKFSNVLFKDTDFGGCSFKKCDFNNATLTQVSLNNATLTETVFSPCFSKATIDNTRFEGCLVRGIGKGADTEMWCTAENVAPQFLNCTLSITGNELKNVPAEHWSHVDLTGTRLFNADRETKLLPQQKLEQIQDRTSLEFQRQWVKNNPGIAEEYGLKLSPSNELELIDTPPAVEIPAPKPTLSEAISKGDLDLVQTLLKEANPATLTGDLVVKARGVRKGCYASKCSYNESSVRETLLIECLVGEAVKAKQQQDGDRIINKEITHEMIVGAVRAGDDTLATVLFKQAPTDVLAQEHQIDGDPKKMTLDAFVAEELAKSMANPLLQMRREPLQKISEAASPAVIAAKGETSLGGGGVGGAVNRQIFYHHDGRSR